MGHSFPSKERLLISWLQSLSAVILESEKIKSVTASTFSLFICREVMGQDAMILGFWMLSFVCLFVCFCNWAPVGFNGVRQCDESEWRAVSNWWTCTIDISWCTQGVSSRTLRDTESLKLKSLTQNGMMCAYNQRILHIIWIISRLLRVPSTM